jgi:hypothetical protein
MAKTANPLARLGGRRLATPAATLSLILFFGAYPALGAATLPRAAAASRSGGAAGGPECSGVWHHH